MIAFQHIESRRFLADNPGQLECLCDLLHDAYPWHEGDEMRLRGQFRFLAGFRTVTFSTRIDHPMNDLAALTAEQLEARYPIERRGGK